MYLRKILFIILICFICNVFLYALAENKLENYTIEKESTQILVEKNPMVAPPSSYSLKETILYGWKDPNETEPEPEPAVIIYDGLFFLFIISLIYAIWQRNSLGKTNK